MLMDHRRMVTARIPAYHLGEPNHCPGCSGTNWIRGRFSAECARCGEALPIAEHRPGVGIAA